MTGDYRKYRSYHEAVRGRVELQEQGYAAGNPHKTGGWWRVYYCEKRPLVGKLRLAPNQPRPYSQGGRHV